MTPLDEAITNLIKLHSCFLRQQNMPDALKVQYELLGYCDVRDGIPRGEREVTIHHAELRAIYRQARQDAAALAGKGGGYELL